MGPPAHPNQSANSSSQNPRPIWTKISVVPHFHFTRFLESFTPFKMKCVRKTAGLPHRNLHPRAFSHCLLQCDRVTTPSQHPSTLLVHPVCLNLSCGTLCAALSLSHKIPKYRCTPLGTTSHFAALEENPARDDINTTNASSATSAFRCHRSGCAFVARPPPTMHNER